jgi:topoisomerase-4 subunit A
MKALEEDVKEVKYHLKHLTDYAIAWFEKLRTKYGKGRERKTELRAFEKVTASEVALANVKLYVNIKDGFIGTGLRRDEFVCDCSDLDEIIVFREDGKFLVTKVQDKVFVGKDILHVAVFRKADERTIYNMIYRDGKTGTSYVKRFAVLGVTRDREYDLTKGSKGSRVWYFTVNPNGEAEVVTIQLKAHSKLRKLQFDLDFADIAIKGRGSQGNIVSKYPLRKITLKSKGISTLSGRKIWFDEILCRLNVDERGKYLGEFDGDDKILLVHEDGSYELSSFELTNHFDNNLVRIEKFNPKRIYSMIHQDGKSKNYFIKRFLFEDIAFGRRVSLINEAPESKMILISAASNPLIKIDITKGKSNVEESIEQNLAELIDVKGMRAQGNRLSIHDVQSVELLTTEEDEGKIEEVEVEQERVVPDSETVVEKPNKAKVDLEITNPEDVDIDETGQIGLF